MKTTKDSELIYNKGDKNIYNGEKPVFSISGSRKIEQPHVKEWY